MKELWQQYTTEQEEKVAVNPMVLRDIEKNVFAANSKESAVEKPVRTWKWLRQTLVITAATAVVVVISVIAYPLLTGQRDNVLEVIAGTKEDLAKTLEKTFKAIEEDEFRYLKIKSFMRLINGREITNIEEQWIYNNNNRRDSAVLDTDYDSKEEQTSSTLFVAENQERCWYGNYYARKALEWKESYTCESSSGQSSSLFNRKSDFLIRDIQAEPIMEEQKTAAVLLKWPKDQKSGTPGLHMTSLSAEKMLVISSLDAIVSKNILKQIQSKEVEQDGQAYHQIGMPIQDDSEYLYFRITLFQKKKKKTLHSQLFEYQVSTDELRIIDPTEVRINTIEELYRSHFSLPLLLLSHWNELGEAVETSAEKQGDQTITKMRFAFNSDIQDSIAESRILNHDQELKRIDLAYIDFWFNLDELRFIKFEIINQGGETVTWSELEHDKVITDVEPNEFFSTDYWEEDLSIDVPRVFR